MDLKKKIKNNNGGPFSFLYIVDQNILIKPQ